MDSCWRLSEPSSVIPHRLPWVGVSQSGLNFDPPRCGHETSRRREFLLYVDSHMWMGGWRAAWLIRRPEGGSKRPAGHA